MRALAGAGRLTHLHAAYDEAERLHAASLDLARELADAHGIAAALTELGMVARVQGKLPRSVALIEEGLARFRALGDEAGIAVALLNLGTTFGNQGDLTRAVAVLTDALARSEALGDLRHIAIAQALLGTAQQERGDQEAATRYLAASLAGHAHLGDRWFVTYTLMTLAEVQLAKAQWEAAARLLGAAEAMGVGVSSRISRHTYEALGTAVRAHLDAARFEAAWEAGHALTFEEAVAAAHTIATPTAPEPKEPPPPPSDTARLTRREREVAQLLARGYSDRQIADTLFVSVGTVGWHVHHILQKLDLHSRHQVAAWLRTHEPHTSVPD
jgi:non-specific serine/threonine protein kinase